jgi:hypothetical protein
MFIREVKKQRSKDSKTFYQYNLVQTSRIEGKVKQNVILYLGSDPLLAEKINQKTVLNILKSRIFRQPGLFPDDAPNICVHWLCPFMKSTWSNMVSLCPVRYPFPRHLKEQRCTGQILKGWKWVM